LPPITVTRRAMVFGIVHGRIKAAPGRVPPITVARKAMISESPVNTFIEIGVRPPPLYFRQSFAANPTVEIRVGRFRGTK
jgi:hypothetical protein